MNSKIIKTIAAYAGNEGFTDFTIHQGQGRPILRANRPQGDKTLVLPPILEEQIASSLRRLLHIAENELADNVYYKISDKKGTSSFRFSIVPDGQDEKIIISVIPKKSQAWRLPKLGLDRYEQLSLRRALKNRTGLILVAGGHNQGRTATMAALANALDKENRLIYSLERYNELAIDGINRLLLSQRQNPVFQARLALKSGADVIMIDDARNGMLTEAMDIARTGRLVIIAASAASETEFQSLIKEKGFAKLHKENVPTTLMYQELAARNCPQCLERHPVDSLEISFLKKNWPENKDYCPSALYRSRGCRHCSHRRSKGEIGIFTFIENGKTYQTMAEDASVKAASGLISLEHFLK